MQEIACQAAVPVCDAARSLMSLNTRLCRNEPSRSVIEWACGWVVDSGAAVTCSP